MVSGTLIINFIYPRIMIAVGCLETYNESTRANVCSRYMDDEVEHGYVEAAQK